MSRPQRYRLTFEFVLRNRVDYALARSLCQIALNEVISKLGFSAQADYLSIEKCSDPSDPQ